MDQPKIESTVRSFVEGLMGRYEKAMPKENMILNLSELMWATFDVSKVNILGETYLGNIAYQVGGTMFVSILECKHNAPGNGHHVAQRFSEAFVEAFREQ